MPAPRGPLVLRFLLALPLALAGIAPSCRPAPEPPLAAPSRAGGSSAAAPGAGASATALRPLGGSRVRLLAPAAAGRPELARLAAELDAGAGEMAARLALPVGPELTVALEPDYAAQARHTGQVGEAVSGRGADLALVYHPDDLDAYRFALARVLLARSGLARNLPPWVERGAALWLAGRWYGRPWRDWLPTLAAAHALPEAGQLLATGEQPDASAPLWTPAAAALVERLPGETLAEKLRSGAPAEEELARSLSGLAGLAGLGRDAVPPPARMPAAPRVRGPAFLRGVSLAMSNSIDGGYHAPAVDRALDRLARVGVDAVSLMPFAYQADPRRPALVFLNRRPASETDLGLLHAARRVHARGWRVLWKPHVWIRSSWPGDVEMTGERDWELWWSAYRRYVLHHAFLAAWARSDLFCVGVELDRTAAREREWRELIADVRRLYPGPVTFASNWDRAAALPFWDALDLVGVDAYYPLAAAEEADRAALDRGARSVAGELAALARRAGRPLLLTELGFPARRAAWRDPHVEGGELSVADQAAAYRALLPALGRAPWLAGAFVWKAFSGEPEEGGERSDFTFLGRPTEAVLRDYYAPPRLRRRP